jgi:hypothetical protein
MVAFGAVEPFATCKNRAVSIGFLLAWDTVERHIQHADRMATWALRMCLLRVELARAVDADRQGSGMYAPHGCDVSG